MQPLIRDHTPGVAQNDKGSTERDPTGDGVAPLVPLPVSGYSMWPTLHPGDILWTRLAPTELHSGDIAVFRHGGELFAHRFLAYRHRNRQRFYLAKGDRHWAFDPLWPEQAFFGVAVTLERNDISYPLTTTPVWQRWFGVCLNLIQGAMYHIKYRFFAFLLILILLTSAVEASVSLTSFTADFQGDGVSLHWETASEVNALGFNLYRSLLPSGGEVLLNPDIIPALGDVTGSTYDFFDENPPQSDGYQYRLEEIDADGQIESFAPISIYRVTPTPTATASPTVTAEPPTATPVPPTPTASATAIITITPTSTLTPTQVASSTPTLTFTPTPAISPSPSPTLNPNATPTFTPQPTLTPTPIPTNTSVPPASSTVPPTLAPTRVDTSSPTATSTSLVAPVTDATPIPTQAPTATQVTTIAIEPAATLAPLKFPDGETNPPNGSSGTGRIPANIFAIVGIFSLLVAGILIGILIYFRRRWPQ